MSNYGQKMKRRLAGILVIIAVLSPVSLIRGEDISREYAQWRACRDNLKTNSSLVLYYTMEEGAGNKVKNLAEGGIKGIEVEGISFKRTSLLNGDIKGAEWVKESHIPGKYCLSLGGNGARMFVSGLPAEINNLPQKTLMVTLKVLGQGTGTACPGCGRIIDKENDTYNAGWRLWISNPANNAKDKFRLQYNHNFTEKGGSWFAQNLLEFHKWYTVAMTYDCTSVSNVPVFYINGEKAGTGWNEGIRGTSTDDSTIELCFGAMGKEAVYWPLWALVDEIAIFNRVLADKEIKDLYGGEWYK